MTFVVTNDRECNVIAATMNSWLLNSARPALELVKPGYDPADAGILTTRMLQNIIRDTMVEAREDPTGTDASKRLFLQQRSKSTLVSFSLNQNT